MNVVLIALEVLIGLCLLSILFQVMYWLALFRIWHKYFPYRCKGGMDEAIPKAV